MNLTLRTFQEWSNRGFRIIKGSKAIWVDNVPMFSDKQVEVIQWYSDEDEMERAMIEALNPNQ